MKFITLDPRTVLIVDHMYYELEEIDEWLWQNLDYHPRDGMIVTFRSEPEMTHFLLKWS